MENSLESKLEDLFSKSIHGNEQKNELKEGVELLLKLALELPKTKPILEIRVPGWSGLKRNEYSTFLDRIRKACGKDFVVVVLPMRHDKIQIKMGSDFDTQKFREEWLKFIQTGSANMMMETNPTYVTDIGTVKIHTLYNTNKEAFKELEANLRLELETLLESHN